MNHEKELFFSKSISEDYKNYFHNKIESFCEEFSMPLFYFNFLVFVITYTDYIQKNSKSIDYLWNSSLSLIITFIFIIFHKASQNKFFSFDIYTIKGIFLTTIVSFPFMNLSSILSRSYYTFGDPVRLIMLCDTIVKYLILIFYNYSFKFNLISTIINVYFLWGSFLYYNGEMNTFCYTVNMTGNNLGILIFSYFYEKKILENFFNVSIFKKEKDYFLDMFTNFNNGIFIFREGEIMINNEIFKHLKEKNNDLLNFLVDCFLNLDLDKPDDQDNKFICDFKKFLIQFRPKKLLNETEKKGFYIELEKLVNSHQNETKFIKIGTIIISECYYEISLRCSGKLEILFIDFTEIRKAEKLRAETKFNNIYLSKITHEFKNPMLSIISLCENISENFQNHGESKVLIKGLCNYLLYLIEDLNFFCKSQKEKLSLENKPLIFDPFKTVQTLEFCSNIFKIRQLNDPTKTKVSIINDFDDDLPDLKLSETKFKQVLINLLSNSYKFTLSGKIILSAKIHDNDNCKPYIRFMVSDTGVGVPNECLDRLFNLNEDLSDYNYKYNKNGSGYGLKIVNEICQKSLNSNIQYNSEINKGSSFWFDITLQTIERKNKDLDKTQIADFKLIDSLTLAKLNYLYNKPSELQEKRIIVCDDEDLLRDSLINLIQKESQNQFIPVIYEAKNGLEALNIIVEMSIKNIPIDYIFLDETMPIMKGSVCIFNLKTMMNENFINKLKIVSVTSYFDEETQDYLKKQGADEIKTKPLSKNDIKVILLEKNEDC